MTVNDGTAKWELVIIASNEDLTALKNTLNGSINNKSLTYIASGSFTNKGTIPLPSGYSRKQCKYVAWFSDKSMTYVDDVPYFVKVNQSTGYVAGYVFMSSSNKPELPYHNNNDGDPIDISGKIDYLVVAVK